MATDTKNVIFKIFIAIIILIAAYFAYREIKRLMVARKVEKSIAKTEEKVADFVMSMQDVNKQSDQ